jgi:DNA invertase Pin-like site-specific DNA recombinase
MEPRRAIGIVRVSETKGREGESFASPGEQLDRIKAACARDGLQLVQSHEELDVSGGRPLDQRPGLREAVAAIEAGEADVIAAAYFDRLFRSLSTQTEVIERVEAAGGQVLAVDVGQVTNGSAGQWLSGTMLGAVSEYYRRSVKERSGEAQSRAVARGVVPWPNVPPGYLRGADGVLVPDPKTAPIVAEAFRMRMDGATVKEVRTFLSDNGVKRSYHGVLALLASRVVLGEIHFGKLVNLTAHEPIVDRETWQRVQRMVVPRGRKPKSERLLARLDVLRCANCGSRMVVGSSNHRQYAIYRCPPTGDCERRVTISAEMVEELVTSAVRLALANAEGRASAESNLRDAEVALEHAQSALDAAFRAFAGFEDESAARDRLSELRQVREDARDRLDQLGGQRAVITVSAAADWDTLSISERRALIRATVERVNIASGRGSDRVTIELFRE